MNRTDIENLPDAAIKIMEELFIRVTARRPINHSRTAEAAARIHCVLPLDGSSESTPYKTDVSIGLIRRNECMQYATNAE